MYIPEPSRRIQEFWLVSSEDPSVVIVTAQSRFQSDQQWALLDPILVVDGASHFFGGGLTLLDIRFAPLEYLASARSQSCLQGLPMFSLFGVCDDFCDAHTLSVLLALCATNCWNFP